MKNICTHTIYKKNDLNSTGYCSRHYSAQKQRKALESVRSNREPITAPSFYLERVSLKRN